MAAAAIVPVIASAVVGTLASVIVGKLTGNKILGSIAGLAAGFGIGSMMSGAGGAAGSSTATGAAEAAGGMVDAGLADISAMDFTGGGLSAGVMGDTAGGIIGSGSSSGAAGDFFNLGAGSSFGAAPATAGTSVAGTQGLGAIGNMSLLSGGPAAAESGGVLGFLKGLMPTSELGKLGLMQMGGSLLSSLGQMPMQDALLDIKQQEADLLQRQGHWGVSNAPGSTYSGPDLAAELARINANVAPRSAVAPTIASATVQGQGQGTVQPIGGMPGGPLPTSLLGQAAAMGQLSPSAIAQAAAARQQIANLNQEQTRYG